MGQRTVVLLLSLCGILVSASDPGYIEDLRERSSTRIVSGWEADPGQLPHQLLIRMVNSVGSVSSCGGTIIHSQWGLTAAHCTATRPTIVIRAGLVNITRPVYLFETTTWYNHPLYNNDLPSVVQPNDVALLNFERTLVFDALVQPIRLQSSFDKDKYYNGERLIASGWGRTWTDGATPENLNWVYLLGTSNFDCFVSYGFNPIIVDSTICAGPYNVSSQSTCQGDSGGPLTVVDVDGETSQVGIASFVSGRGCHAPDPAGFVRPGHYHDWYYNVTGIDFDWIPYLPTTTTESPTETEGPIEPTSTTTERPTETTIIGTERPTEPTLPTESATETTIIDTVRPTEPTLPTENPTETTIIGTERPTEPTLPTESATETTIIDTVRPTEPTLPTENPTETTIIDTERPTEPTLPTENQTETTIIDTERPTEPTLTTVEVVDTTYITTELPQETQSEENYFNYVLHYITRRLG